MTAERVRRAQEEMSEMLPAKDDYVVRRVSSTT